MTVVHLLMFLNIFFQQGPQGQKGSKGSTVSCVFILISVSTPFVAHYVFYENCFLVKYVRDTLFLVRAHKVRRETLD